MKPPCELREVDPGAWIAWAVGLFVETVRGGVDPLAALDAVEQVLLSRAGETTPPNGSPGPQSDG